MKPRLRRISGVWYCWIEWTMMGMGFSAKDAYDDWLLLSLKAKK